MTNVTITLGGKERELKFSFLSLRALENHYGKPIGKVFEEEMNKGGLEQLSVFLYACLRKEKLTLNKIEELIDSSIEREELSITDLGEKVKEALKESKIVKSQGIDIEGETSDDDEKN